MLTMAFVISVSFHKFHNSHLFTFISIVSLLLSCVSVSLLQLFLVFSLLFPLSLPSFCPTKIFCLCLLFVFVFNLLLLRTNYHSISYQLLSRKVIHFCLQTNIKVTFKKLTIPVINRNRITEYVKSLAFWKFSPFSHLFFFRFFLFSFCVLSSHE